MAEITTIKKLLPSIVFGLIWGVTYFAVRTILDTVEMSRTIKVLVVLIPAIPFAIFMWAFIRGLARLDELEKRVQMEALAFAFPASIFLLMVLGLLQLVIELPPQDLGYRHVWIFLVLFYSIGLAIASRRYK